MKPLKKFSKRLYKNIITICFNIYSVCFRPQMGYACKFKPTCSCYSKEAFQSHSVLKATFLTIYRVLRCQPFGSGGYDPVPQKQVALNG